MGNNNWPHGFRPLMIDTAGAPVGVREYAKPASDTHAIFTWDLVQKIASSQSVEGMIMPRPSIQTYATGTPGTTLILGSALNYGKASAITWHTIVDDINAIFESQMDGAGSPSVAAEAGKNANVNNTAQTAAGVTISAMQVNLSTVAVTAALDLRILDLSDNIINVEGANALVEVLIMKHQNAQSSAGI